MHYLANLWDRPLCEKTRKLPPPLPPKAKEVVGRKLPHQPPKEGKGGKGKGSASSSSGQPGHYVDGGFVTSDGVFHGCLGLNCETRCHLVLIQCINLVVKKCQHSQTKN